MLLASPYSRPMNARTVAPRVMAVLTENELHDFFPDDLLGTLRSLAGDFAVASPDKHGNIDLPHLFERVNPDVMIGCWHTPTLPAVLPPALRYVCYLAGSVRTLVQRQHLERGLLVTNWGSSISRTVAEGALLHILACLRRSSHWAVAMHTRGAWKNESSQTASLFGRTVGLHGFGAVAKELVRLLKPFGVMIHAWAPDVTPDVTRTTGVRRAASLEALFAESDIVVEVAPQNSATENSVQEVHFRRLRPGSVFVNVARGAIVDEEALVRVAREGQVQFGLDVFAQEPLAVEHPLRGLANVSLTPHLAGPTNDRRRDAGAFAVRNLRAYIERRQLDAVITPEIYDQAT